MNDYPNGDIESSENRKRYDREGEQGHFDTVVSNSKQNIPWFEKYKGGNRCSDG